MELLISRYVRASLFDGVVSIHLSNFLSNRFGHILLRDSINNYLNLCRLRDQGQIAKMHQKSKHIQIFSVEYCGYMIYLQKLNFEKTVVIFV